MQASEITDRFEVTHIALAGGENCYVVRGSTHRHAAGRGIRLLKLVVQAFLGILILVYAGPAQAAGLHEQEVLELVTNEVVQRMQVSRRDVQVVWQDMDASNLVPAIPPGHITLQIAPSAHLGGRGSVPIQILVDGRKFRTIFPRLDVQIFQTVLVAKTRIARGSLVSGGDFGLQRQAVSGLNQVPLVAPQAVLGAEATRDIQAGTVLTAQMFKLPTAVKSGDMVTIVLTSGDLTIIYNGQARSAGAVGQMIKVLNLESKREFTARVTGPNRVEVKLED
jgi:flagella basal body P-ring formation protein FlgA